MRPEFRIPIVVWVITTVLVLVWAARSGSTIYVAVLYVALNGASLALSIWSDTPMHPTALRVMAWCTAAQLPTMLVLVVRGDGNRDHVRAAEASAEKAGGGGPTQGSLG